MCLLSALLQVYTMGSNRHGQLGYAVDTQPTPRRCAGQSGRARSAWDRGKGGSINASITQLGMLCALRCRVAALRARVVAVAAANKHSVAVSTSGDVYTWGSNVLGEPRAAGPFCARVCYVSLWLRLTLVDMLPPCRPAGVRHL